MRPSEVKRIALLGGESSGKTTLALALAEQLHTRWVPEYGRQRWEEVRHTLDPDELLDVARRQVAMEDEAARLAAADGARWLVCDTTPLTTLQYCLHDFGAAPAELRALAARAYDLTAVCEPDFVFVQDGCRRDDGFRTEQHAWTLAQLQARGVPWFPVTGPVAQRVRQVLDRMARHAAAPVA